MRAEYRKHRRNPINRTKLRIFQCKRAIKQKVFGKARKHIWNKFIYSINSRTPTKKVNGNYKPRIVPPLDTRRNIITTHDEIADHYANISIDLHKKSKPGKNRKKNYHTTNQLQTEN